MGSASSFGWLLAQLYRCPTCSCAIRDTSTRGSPVSFPRIRPVLACVRGKSVSVWLLEEGGSRLVMRERRGYRITFGLLGSLVVGAAMLLTRWTTSHWLSIPTLLWMAF